VVGAFGGRIERDGRAAELVTRAPGSTIDLTIPVTRPYNAKPLLAYLAARAIPGVELVGKKKYSRVVQIGNEPRLLDVDFSRATTRGVVRASCVPGSGIDVGALRRSIEALIDADAPVTAVEQRLAEDQALALLVRRNSGSRIPGAIDPFELAVRAILGQQVSVVAARTFAGRVTAQWGQRLGGGEPPLAFAFPVPSRLIEAPLEKTGLSGARAGAIRELSKAVLDRRVDLRPTRNAAPAEESLLRIKGIGPWTAAYIALRGLGDRDAIPIGDLGLRQTLGGRDNTWTAGEVAERAESWRPWRGYGAIHLWNTFLGL
jgi:AraC family transcriptional regulator of adaptative response / DNA-3-methyladenine glycosylase II